MNKHPPDQTTHRFTYSKSELLSLRHLPQSSPSLTHLSKLDSLARSEPYPISLSQSPTHHSSKPAANRHRYSVDQILSLKPSRKPSDFRRPKPAFKRSDHQTIPPRPSTYSSDTPSHTPSSSPPTRSPTPLRSSNFEDFRHPFPSTFASSPEKSHFSKQSSTTRADFASRLSVKTATSAPVSATNEDKRFAPSSPRDEYRRRSPSPMASPKSSSPPPGFEAIAIGKGVVRNGGRGIDALYRSRICKGPDMNRNFAKRIAFRERVVNTPASPLESPPGRLSHAGLVTSRMKQVERDVEEKEACEAEGTEDGKHCCALVENDRVGDCVKPPVVSYNISGVVSFDDFSRRLAEEVKSNHVLKNKMGDDVNSCVEGVGKEGGASDQNDDKYPAEDQDAVDELSKWFGRIAALNNEDESRDEPSSFMKVADVERQMADPKGPKAEGVVEELDSNVLSFFDTIRSQAVDEKTQVGLDNSDAPGPKYKAGCSSGMENLLESPYEGEENVNKRVGVEDAEQLKSSEVEQFFQLFTNGKPVYKTTPNLSQNHGISTANPLSEIQQGSEGNELERWFKALSSQGHLEG